jgi:hypothetical protein
MTRKLVVNSSMILIVITVSVLIWTLSAQSLGINTNDEAQAVRETILRARRIRIESQYTFDTSKFATVYINDPRGGEISSEALAQIREIRQDTSIRKDQVGFLDYEKVAIENLKREYDNYLEELRAKQASGTLAEEEQLILAGKTDGWPTPKPEDENGAAIATQTCELLIITQRANQEIDAAYPIPSTDPEQVFCPTPIPKPSPINAPYRGSDPAILPPEEFEMDIYSIEIEGEVAKAIVHKQAVTSEYMLVKVDGHWFIAGSKLLKASP